MSGPEDASAGRRLLRSFGRTGGRPLSGRRKSLLAQKLSDLRLPDIPQALDPAALFPGAGEIWLEIGFGGAEHLLQQAILNPDVGFLGAEPFMEGVARAVAGIEAQGLSNVRLWPDDVRLLLSRLPDRSLSRVFILFPDPWPKRRHHKRRLVQAGFLRTLWPKLKPGGQVRFATDIISYADEALLAFVEAGGYHWQASSAADWRLPPRDHVTTRYELKRLGDCSPVWFDFLAVASADLSGSS